MILGISTLYYRNFHFQVPEIHPIFALEIKSKNRLHLSIEQALCIRFALSLHREKVSKASHETEV